MKKIAILFFISIFLVLIAGYIYLTKRTQNQSRCNYQKCPEGYRQYRITDCGLGPDGALPCSPEIKKKEDCKCHKICGRNGDKDCPSEMPHCKMVGISDIIHFLCFE